MRSTTRGTRAAPDAWPPPSWTAPAGRSRRSASRRRPPAWTRRRSTRSVGDSSTSAASRAPHWPDMDLLLRDADVYDGTATPPRKADVAVTGGRIMAIDTRIDAHANEVVDLNGLALAPGFIDVHTHSDVSLLHDPSGESKARQGVTTEVVGNC